MRPKAALRLSDTFNTAQIKRVLLKGISELESLWELRSATADRRFRKLSRGKWEAVFVRKKRRQLRAEVQRKQADLGKQPLEVALTKRGVGPGVAR